MKSEERRIRLRVAGGWHTDSTEVTDGAYLGSAGNLNEHESGKLHEYDSWLDCLRFKHKPDKHLIVF